MKTDLHELLRPYFEPFYYCGLWPRPDSGWIYTIYGFLFYMIFYAYFISAQFAAFVLAPTMDEKTEALCWFCSMFELTIKVAIFAPHIKEIISLLDAFNAFEINPEREWIPQYQFRRARIMWRIFFTCATFTASSKMLFSYIQLQMPFPCWYPFMSPNHQEDTSLIGFLVMFVHQLVGIPAAVWMEVCVDNFAVCLICQLSGFLDTVTMDLRELGKRKDDTSIEKHEEEGEKVLRNCMERYDYIYQLAKRLTKLYTNFYLAQGLITMLVLCTTLYQLSVHNPLEYPSFVFTNVNYILAMLSEIFFPTLFGTEMTLKSENLRNELFHSEWYTLGPRVKKAMRIFLERTKRPIKITCVTIFDINLESFTKVLNASYSCFALLKRVNR